MLEYEPVHYCIHWNFYDELLYVTPSVWFLSDTKMVKDISLNINVTLLASGHSYTSLEVKWKLYAAYKSHIIVNTLKLKSIKLGRINSESPASSAEYNSIPPVSYIYDYKKSTPTKI